MILDMRILGIGALSEPINIGRTANLSFSGRPSPYNLTTSFCAQLTLVLKKVEVRSCETYVNIYQTK
jgi:hypothetical protein